MTLAEILRKKADGLQPKIDRCFAQRLTNTRKRAEEDAHQRREGNTLKTIQAVMRRMADLHEAGTCPDALKPWKDITVIGTAVRVVRSAMEHLRLLPHAPQDGGADAGVGRLPRSHREPLLPPHAGAQRRPR